MPVSASDLLKVMEDMLLGKDGKLELIAGDVKKWGIREKDKVQHRVRELS